MENHEIKPAEGSMKRRELLKVLGTGTAEALVPFPAGADPGPGPAARVATAGAAAETYQPKILTAHEWKTIRVLSDIIIPADERSGSATQAGVPEFIDDWLDFRRGLLLDQIRGGLTWLDMECNRLYQHDFVECSEAEQKQILDRIAFPAKASPEDAPAVAFFNRLRDLVVSGFFSSRMGVQDLPYLGNKMVAEWTGCPREVVAKIRENAEKQVPSLGL